MKKHTLAFLLVGTLATVAAVGPACVSQRPSRNGVFNENQYIRKDFLVRADETNDDTGWFMKATILNTSQPNPLADTLLMPGLPSGGGTGMFNFGSKFVRFKITQNKLQMVSMREIAPTQTGLQRTEEVLDAWPITNVDLKYRINLDGEKTNFYEENQELDWQVRQWVKVNLDKDDMSDLAAFGSGFSSIISLCMDEANSTTTLVPNSFKVDEAENYMEWTVNITLPINWYADPGCLGMLASSQDEIVNFNLLDRQSVSFNVMYSFHRADPLPDPKDPNGYVPLVLDEKDPIQHKYLPIQVLSTARDPVSGLVAARQMVGRHNPNKPIIYYFDPGVPQWVKDIAIGPGGIKEQTNKMFEEAGVVARVDFKEWNDGGVERHYGDVRYNFVRWLSGYDQGVGYAGLTTPQSDPRTGELLTANVDLSDFPLQDYYFQRIDAYLQTIGASLDLNSEKEWPNDPPNCKDGDLQPVVPETLANNHNGNSSLYNKMQGYLGKPIYKYGALGPQDFIAKQDEDFFSAYHTVMPYMIYADPDMNPYVVREGGAGVYGPDGISNLIEMYRKEAEFHKIAGKIDRGESPVDDIAGPNGIAQSLEFLNNFRQLMTNHKRLGTARANLYQRTRDPYDVVSFEGLMSKMARICVNGQWEKKAEWALRLHDQYWKGVFWHEFGHALGLEHNFMGNIDRANFPKDDKGNFLYYTSSLMEYSSAPARILEAKGWAPYDKGAISWIYANSGATDVTKAGDSISGQSGKNAKGETITAANAAWKDPKGFDKDGKEIQFLSCSHQHLTYTPLCRMGDSGTTPSEIMANGIDAYEWQYQWRNYRKYRKFWNNAYYANAPANQIIEMRRFLSLWGFDWGSGNLYDMLRRIDYPVPEGVYSNVQYYTQLTNKFNKEASAANQMAAAFHKAIIQQSAGERPYSTIYDKYYGDTTQQGIILDKLYAMLGWVGLWPTDNYDPNVAGGYISSYSSLGDSSYASVSEDAVASMVGGQYDAFPYFVPFAVSIFAQDTHSPAFNGRLEVRDWIGGFVFDRLQDFLDYWRDQAVQYMDPICSGKDFKSCDYDPRNFSDKHNEFIGPDKRVWIWAYVQDRNQWVAVRKDRNIASYIILRNYNDFVVYQLDDGHSPGGAYGTLLPVKYFLDSFRYFN
ncbi:MAG: hypothetical protein HY898_26125 [Deltaproteobacteria bacterium]|nr:hypothetical protein [Deltaproteobacteria bacterium]